jgi:hypothetical protein
MKWVKNTDGKEDAMLTFALVSFAVVTLNILLASFGEVHLGGSSIHFQTLDSSVMGVYLGATFTAYVSRRYTDKKYSDVKSGEVETSDTGSDEPKK